MKVTYQYWVRRQSSLYDHKEAEFIYVGFSSMSDTWNSDIEMVAPLTSFDAAKEKFETQLSRGQLRDYSPQGWTTKRFQETLAIVVRAVLVSDVEIYTGQDLEDNN